MAIQACTRYRIRIQGKHTRNAKSFMSEGMFKTVPVRSTTAWRLMTATIRRGQQRSVVIVLGIFGLSQLAFYLVACTATWLLAQAGNPAVIADVTDRAVLMMHWRWDAIHYYSIATGGYTAYFDHPVPGTEPDMLFAFFPLFPLLVWMVATLLNGFQPPTALPISAAQAEPLLAGIIVVQVATLLACWLLFQLARDETGDTPTATRAVLYFVFFPLAFFYAVPYAEPIFLAASVGSFLAARRRHWIRAGVWAAIASATRPFGILLLPVLALEMVLAWRRGALPRQDRWRALLGLFVAPQGLLLFMGYLWWIVGEPLAFIDAQRSFWHRETVFPLLTLWRGINYTLHPTWSTEPDTYIRTVISTLTVLLFLVGLILAVRQWRSTYVVYGVLLFIQILAVPWPGDTIMHTLGRSAMMFFPVYITLARWGHRPWVHHVIMVVWLPFFGFLTAAYAVGYFVS